MNQVVVGKTIEHALTSVFIVLVLMACGTSQGIPATPPPTAPKDPSGPADPAPTVSLTRKLTPTPTGAIGDGQIVFEDWMISASRHQLYIDSLDGTGSRSVVRSAFDDARPAISPDGKTVLFTRYGNGDDKLMLVNIDGSNARVLREGACGDACLGESEGDSWSPDGRRIVVKRVYFDAEGNFLKISLLIVNLDGTGTSVLTEHKAGDDFKLKPGDDFEDREADWSPDAKRIAFLRVDHSTDPERDAIFTIDPEGKHLQQVTPWALGASEPDWAPDGTRIAFNVPGVTFLGGEQNIYTIRPDGTELQQITAHLEMGDNNPKNLQATFDPSWSPDGSQLMFTHFPSTNGLADLFVVNSDGSDVHVFSHTRLMNESHANWGIDPLS